MPTAEWPLPLKSLSASALAQFRRCPEQFRRQRIKGDMRFGSSASAVMGNAVHGSAEANYSQKIISGSDISVPDVELAYADTFDKEVEDSGGANEIDWSVRVGKNRVRLKPGEAKDMGVPLARTYRQDVAPGIQPVATEEWFRVDVPGVPVPLRGRIDLIDDRINDLKFGAQLKQKPETSWRDQAFTYLLAKSTSNRDGSIRVDGLDQLSFAWHTGTWGSARSGPKVVTPNESPDLVLPRTNENMAIALNLVRSTVASMVATWGAFGPDEEWPGAFQHTWACQYCLYGPNQERSCFWWTGMREELTLI